MDITALAEQIGAGAALLMLLAIIGAIRGDWVPGYLYRALQEENRELKRIAYRAVGAAEGAVEVAKK